MAIEVKQGSDRVGNTLRTTVEFSGATYNTRLNSVVSSLPSSSQVDVVKFTSTTSKGKTKTIEYAGSLARVVTDALAHPFGDFPESKDSIMERAFSSEILDKPEGLVFEQGVLAIPESTEVTIKSKDLLEGKRDQKREPHIYQPSSVLVPPEDALTENWIKKSRSEYDAYLRTQESLPSSRIYQPSFAYKARCIGGIAENGTSIGDAVESLCTITEEARTKGRLAIMLNELKNGGISTVGELRSRKIGQLLGLRAMGANKAMFLKVAFAPIENTPSSTN